MIQNIVCATKATFKVYSTWKGCVNYIRNYNYNEYIIMKILLP